MKHRIYPLIILALLALLAFQSARAESVPAVPEPFTGRLSIIEGTTIDIECFDSNLLDWRMDDNHIRVNCSSTDRDEAK